jgi:transcriptional regulator with XRE-family HTH domain
VIDTSERIKELRNKLGLKQEDLAVSLELTKNYISLVETGKRKLSPQSVELLCTRYGVNREWLENGKGEMFLTKGEEISAMIGSIQNESDDNFKKRLITALLKLDDDGWKKLEILIDMISEKGK